jgi:uncharacterized protein (TIGR00255 family)
MAQSMTGFASETISIADWNLSLECKSVNSRFLDLNIKLPEALRASEATIRQKVSAVLNRGKVEINIRLERSEAASDLIVNHNRLSKLKTALAQIEAEFPDSPAPSQLDVLMSPGIWSGDSPDRDLVTRTCEQAVSSLLKSLVDMRKQEGDKLVSLIKDRCQLISAMVAEYRTQLPSLRETQRQRVVDKLQSLNVAYDQDRLEEELAFLASKADVAEELDRLDAHVAAVNDAASGNGPCGRRLDFLMQELNREANTLGAKTTSLVTTNTSVDLKVIIEQMREQVQNLE